MDSLIVWEGLPGLSVHLELRTGDPQSDPLNAETLLTEDEDEPGYYSLIVPEALTGRFRWRVTLSDVAVDSGWIPLTDTAGPFFVQDAAVVTAIRGVLPSDAERDVPEDWLRLNQNETGVLLWFSLRDPATGAPVAVPANARFHAKAVRGEPVCEPVLVQRDGARWGLVVPAGLTEEPTRGNDILWSLRVDALKIAGGYLTVNEAA